MGMATALAESFAARLGRVGMACAIIALLSLVGCEKPSAKIPSVPSVPALPPNDTPEGKLARIMQRLDSALEAAQAPSGTGVISERRAYHKLLRPEGEAGPYEAVIFIETKLALAPIALNAAAQAKLEAEAEKQDEVLSDEPRKPLVVKDTEQIEVEEYPLVYDGGRWKLAKELESPGENEPPSTAQILFDYALDAN